MSGTEGHSAFWNMIWTSRYVMDPLIEGIRNGKVPAENFASTFDTLVSKALMQNPSCEGVVIDESSQSFKDVRDFYLTEIMGAVYLKAKNS